MNKIFKSGKDIFVKISNSVREGSIAKISSYDYNSNATISYDALKNIRLKFDDSKSNFLMPYYNLIWLKNYTGPTNLIITKNEENKKIVKNIPDMLNQQIQVGDCILYTRANTTFGVVTNITDAGTVMFKPIKPNSKIRSAYLSTDCLVIRDGLKNDILLMKLSME